MAIQTKLDKKAQKMVIEIDLVEWKASRSGKTEVISTGGNMPVSGSTYKLGLNLMRPRSEKK